MDFNLFTKAALACAVFAVSSSAFATGIPVYCFNCQDATYNAAHSIIDAMRLQTEAIMNAKDYEMRTTLGVQTAIATSQGVTEQRIKNAYAMDPSIAKPRLACSQTATAGVRSGAKGASANVRKVLSSKTASYNSRGANLPPGESRKEYSVTTVLETFAEGEDADSTTIIADDPIPNESAAIAKHRKVRDATVNPYPVELPPAEEIKRIESNGSQGEREGLSQMKVLTKRQEMAQFVLDQDESKRIQYVNSETFKDQLSYYTESMDKETKALWSTGKLSNYQVDELGANYRALSPTWIKQVSANASEVSLLKELVLAQAESLYQQGITNKYLREQSIITATKEIREISKDGLQTR
jgi:hypothetical protein